MARDIPSALATDGAPLYVSERKVYPREISGRFQRLRVLAVVVLLGLYYIVPWLQWGHRQAVLFDLPARKFYILGLAFWPQDFFFLAMLLVMAGLSLFFFTAVAGRLWCGYACPQTVWTEVFLWMEQWTEGDRAKRMKLDAAPWSANKLRRKASKHALWLVFALWTGFTFVGFFTPIRELTDRLVPFAWSGWETFWVLFYALATWGNAGVLREQVCKYMCPYARFQSAMFDRNTLIISYDPMRGEPRGARKKSALSSVLERARGLLSPELAEASVVAAAHNRSAADLCAGARATTALAVDMPIGGIVAPLVSGPEDLGDCIDCTICVQVCPTGIDIRNGLQYECIACGACVDACDSVMDKMGYPRGLVRYATQNAMDGKPVRLLRPRVIIYFVLLVILLSGTVAGIALRKPLIVDIIRDHQLYHLDDNGQVENAYTLRLVNKDDVTHRYALSLRGDKALRLDDVPEVITAAPEEVLTIPVTVAAEAGTVRGGTDLRFIVRDLDTGLVMHEETRFYGPVEQ
ncbi:cytochrome c oxidase accessory protein CcoG [soil metagenome]